MDPIKFEGMNETFAEGQPEYIPLPVYKESDGKVTSVWELSDDERDLIADGANVCLCQSTFNQALQPVNLWIAKVYELEDGKEKPKGTQCQKCGEYGEDRRTLRMSCLYEMNELKIPFKIIPREKGQDIYSLTVCKDCRGDWMGAIENWFLDRKKNN